MHAAALVAGPQIVSTPSRVVRHFAVLATTARAVVADARQLAARVWTARYLVEIDAAVRFERLARELAELDGLHDVIQLATRAGEDERRHGELCLELIAHFGGKLPEPPSPAAPPLRLAGATARERLLYEIVALCCVTETLSTALLGTMCDEAVDPVGARAMRSIVKDEVRHSQLGWAHLAAEHQQGMRDVVGSRLPAMLAQTLEPELFSRRPEHPLQEELDTMGALGRAKRRRIVVETLSEVVFPGLERFGIDIRPGQQWLQQQAGAGVSHAVDA